MSEERKRIDCSGFSEKLHLFICPLFTEPDLAIRDSIPQLTSVNSSRESWVKLTGDPPKKEPDRSAFFEPMAKDLIRDFKVFLTQLNSQKHAAWDIPNLSDDISDGINNSRSVFSDDPCWFHISHQDNGYVLDFTQRFFRKGDNPGIVFGYFHESNDYTNAWSQQDPRSVEFEKCKNKSINDDEVDVLIGRLTDLIDTSGISEPTQKGARKIASIEWTPSLEVSLRIPIRNPSYEEKDGFEAELEAVRVRLKQTSVGIFDEENMKMYYLGSKGWTEGSSRFVKVALGPKAPQEDRPKFLTRVKNAVKESATITNLQSPSVFTNRNEGKIIPANGAYLYDLLNQTHLGFSFFPIAQATQTVLSDICLLDKGRWLWDSVFPYKMNGVERAASSHNLFPPLVLLDVRDTQCAVYAPYVPGSKCLCGWNYPDSDLECTQNTSQPVGELRCECPASRHPDVNAGDPQAVLEARHGNPKDAGKAWDEALKKIS
jgi:hypothetical protein